MFGFKRRSSQDQIPQQGNFKSSSKTLLDSKQPFSKSKNKLAFDKFDYMQEKPHIKRPHETPNWRSRYQSRPTKNKAKPVCSYGDQSSLQQTSQLQNRLDIDKICDDMEKQMLKAFKAVVNSPKKSTAPQPSSEVDATS